MIIRLFKTSETDSLQETLFAAEGVSRPPASLHQVLFRSKDGTAMDAEVGETMLQLERDDQSHVHDAPDAISHRRTVFKSGQSTFAETPLKEHKRMPLSLDEPGGTSVAPHKLINMRKLRLCDASADVSILALAEYDCGASEKASLVDSRCTTPTKSSASMLPDDLQNSPFKRSGTLASIASVTSTSRRSSMFSSFYLPLSSPKNPPEVPLFGNLNELLATSSCSFITHAQHQMSIWIGTSAGLLGRAEAALDDTDGGECTHPPPSEVVESAPTSYVGSFLKYATSPSVLLGTRSSVSAYPTGGDLTLAALYRLPKIERVEAILTGPLEDSLCICTATAVHILEGSTRANGGTLRSVDVVHCSADARWILEEWNLILADLQMIWLYVFDLEEGLQLRSRVSWTLDPIRSVHWWPVIDDESEECNMCCVLTAQQAYAVVSNNPTASPRLLHAFQSKSSAFSVTRNEASLSVHRSGSLSQNHI